MSTTVSFLTEGHLLYLTNIICDLLLVFQHTVATAESVTFYTVRESAGSNKLYQSPEIMSL